MPFDVYLRELIALESAREMGMDTPGLALADSHYMRLSEQGYEDKGAQALYKIWRS